MRTWINIICVDNKDKILSYNNKIPLFRSCHNLIDVKIELFIPKPPCESFTYRKLNNITSEAINEFLICCGGAFLASTLELEPALSCLNSNLLLAIDELAPTKTINPRKHKQPCINAEIQLLVNKRKATKKRYLISKNVLLLNELVKLSDEIEVL